MTWFYSHYSYKQMIPYLSVTIWLFNIAMENHHAIKNGKPSISMGHGFHGKLLVITRGYIIG